MQSPSVATRLLLGFLVVACVRDPATVCIFLSASLIPITFLSACQPLCLSVNLSFHQFRFASVWQTVSSYRAFLLDWLLSPFAFCWFKVESIWWSFSVVSRPVLTSEVCSRYIQLPDRTFQSFLQLFRCVFFFSFSIFFFFFFFFFLFFRRL